MAHNTEDESVDGPKIVAEILSRMSATSRDRLLDQIQLKAPELASAIEESLYRFDEILELSAKGLQILLKEIDQRDLILALKATTQEITQSVFAALSERRQQMLQEELDNLPPTRLVEIESAQRRITLRIHELISLGKITRSIDSDLYV